jgi:hypothetical protein
MKLSLALLALTTSTAAQAACVDFPTQKAPAGVVSIRCTDGKSLAVQLDKSSVYANAYSAHLIQKNEITLLSDSVVYTGEGRVQGCDYQANLIRVNFSQGTFALITAASGKTLVEASNLKCTSASSEYLSQ